MHFTQQITIRGVDATTKDRLQTRARQRGLSLNAYNLELLRRDAGTSNSTTTNGLEQFAGILPLEPDIEAALTDQRRSAPDKWDMYGV